MGLAGFLGIDSMSIFPTGRSVIFLIPVIAQVGIGKPLFSRFIEQDITTA